jgi:hypothetical protein
VEEVNIAVERADSKAHLTLQWRGGAICELDLNLRPYMVPRICPDEDTIELVRRLAVTIRMQ